MRSVKKFKTIVDFVWKRRKNYLRGCFEDNEEDWTRCLDEPYFFDFPEYGGLPNKISKTLSSEFVDAMQYVWEDMSNGTIKTKRQFIKELFDQCECLGEPLSFTKTDVTRYK